MFSNNRDEMRLVFFNAWRKHLQHLPVEPLEAQLIEIILLHPEYHTLLSDPENQHQDYDETNPFLHLSLHLAIREQVGTDRPAGIKKIYQDLCVKQQNILHVEHMMMNCLADILWQAQQSGNMPDEAVYLVQLKNLLNT